ncbi:Tyrosine recombinase XerD [uncultured Prevotella sp.]|uniref:tyrosine-type recombinase/integrase n=1 Tax=uncultured Prevotella sp. TaxID=159272 RepID=UPI001A54B58F|nr:site-specific integrase [uncultured Prevotella sp.]VTY06227.1 Tyrosine recombinase XerD [uncultured Prevotella sp.]
MNLITFCLEGLHLRPKKRVGKPDKAANATFLGNFVTVASKGVSESTKGNYHTAVRSFHRFNKGNDIALSGITADKVKAYEWWLRKQGVCNNTISCYLRSLRAIYNKGVAKHKVRDAKPFKGVFTGNEPTVKTSLKASELQRLRMLALSEGSFLAFARDLFLFSFCTMGMPPTDLARLRRSHIKGDTLTYRRQKTGRQVSIKLTGQMREIMERYRTEDSDFIFPILARHRYRSFLSQYNRALKALEQKAYLSTHLSSYTARHSWASLAYEHNIDLPVISQALGHGNTRTTQLYIAKIDNRLVDKANKKLLREIFGVPLDKRCTRSA